MFDGVKVLAMDIEELRSVILSILRTGLLNIRVLGWSGRADLCAMEADHLHNLPDLIRDPKLKFVEYYFNISRMSYIKEAGESSAFRAFADDWARLKEILDRLRSDSAR
jgi:hypothetical protein